MTLQLNAYGNNKMVFRKILITLIAILPSVTYANSDCSMQLTGSSKYSDINKINKCLNKEIKNAVFENRKLKLQLNEIQENQVKTLHLLRGVEKVKELSSDNSSAKYKDKNSKLLSNTVVGPYSIDLIGCTKKSKRLTCEFRITNQGGGESLVFHRTQRAGSKIYLSSGYVAKAKEIYVGDIGGSNRTYYNFRMPIELPVKGTVVFNDADDNKISLLQLRLSLGTAHNPMVAEFRNIVALNK